MLKAVSLGMSAFIEQGPYSHDSYTRCEQGEERMALWSNCILRQWVPEAENTFPNCHANTWGSLPWPSSHFWRFCAIFGTWEVILWSLEGTLALKDGSWLPGYFPRSFPVRNAPWSERPTNRTETPRLSMILSHSTRILTASECGSSILLMVTSSVP